MAIKYYPNRIQKQTPPAIDRVMAMRKPQLIRGSKDITESALDVVVSANRDWHLNSIKFTFSSGTSRDFSAKVMGGRKVVEDLNDSLWFQHSDTLPQNIIINSGFYTGTELATELETQLDSNVAFTALSVTFTVTYSATTGLFTITPSAGNIRYLNVNSMTVPRYQDSIAGHLFGLTANVAYGSPITSNETVYGLNNEAWIIDETESIVLENFFDDLKVLDIDQAIHLETSVAGVIVNYEVNYEEIT
jgi:hypothetical protein